MNLQFFTTCSTLEEAKKLYYKLAKENHPDRGGDLETMKRINNEYDFVTAKLSQGTQFKEEERSQQFEMAQQYKEKITAIINIPGLIIEICGLWIWITGETREVKETLKENGFFWAIKKKAWYWRPEELKSFKNKNPLSMEEIRSKYNSTIINGKNNLLHQVA